jgi:two-component system, chemotaxis family, chemotaxis protein CheY
MFRRAMEKLTGTTVIIADRHQPMRAIIRHVLGTMGVKAPTEVGDGSGLVELVARTGPDIAVLDYRLPNVDGIEITRRLRRLADDRLRRIGVVLLAASATPELVREARNAGVDEFLCKPFSAGGLQQRVRAVAFHRREFIDVPTYVGPCRRRFVNPFFDGDGRRLTDEAVPLPTELAEMCEAALAS